MSSGGWEVVGKNKKDKNNGKSTKLTKAEKKKFIENAPKLEDFLPLSQVKTLYDNLDSNKENKKPAKEKEHKTKENEEKKKQQKQQHQHQEKKKQEFKEKPPKTIKDALNAINAEEMSNVLMTAKLRFPEAPLIWLKDLATYLNTKIPIEKEDAVFSGKPKDYPLSIVPKEISSILENAVEMAGQQTTQLFYEITSTTMATDMVKGVAVIGHKIFLQLLAQLNPQIIVANIPKLISVRNSYQNRKAIGLSLVWAFSQAGKKNLAIGLKVWHEVMSSMLETKSYANYIAQILSDLVFDHENVYDLSPDLYLDVIEDTYSGKYNIPPAIGKEINNSIEKLRSILFQNRNINYSKLFEMLIAKANQKVNANYRDELVKALVACMAKDIHCFSIWRSVYTKFLYQSSLLLTHIDVNWHSVPPTIKTKALKEMLIVFQTTNERWKKSKNELAHACNKICKTILTKMTASTNKKFPWSKGSILLLFLIGAVLAYDCHKHGSFEASTVGRFAKNNEILLRGQKVWTDTKLYVSTELEARCPEYYKATIDICTQYIKLIENLYLITRNLSIRMYNNIITYIETNGPVFLATVEHYFPGLLDQIHSLRIRGLEFIKTNSVLLGEKVIDHSTVLIQWLQKNVFVGKLSPENLQNYATQAIDTTQTFASQTYDWVYEKVQTLSKVQ